VIVCDYLSDRCADIQLGGLLHDAHEALWGFGDVCRPAKNMNVAIKTLLKEYALTFDLAIAQHFNTYANTFTHADVKHADNVVLSAELRDLMETPCEPWCELPPCFDVPIIEPLGINDACALFLERYERLKVL